LDSNLRWRSRGPFIQPGRKQHISSAAVADNWGMERDCGATMAGFARLVGVTRSAITKAVKRGRITSLSGNVIDPKAAESWSRREVAVEAGGMTRSDLARLVGCSKQAVADAVGRGRITLLPSGNLDPTSALAAWREPRKYKCAGCREKAPELDKRRLCPPCAAGRSVRVKVFRRRPCSDFQKRLIVAWYFLPLAPWR